MAGGRPYAPRRSIRLEQEMYVCANRMYFFTVQAYGECPPFTHRGLNEITIRALVDQSLRTNCSVFTYCLMPDHIHFLARPNVEGVCVLGLVNRFKGVSTNESWKFGWRGKLWQPRYYDHVGRTNENLREIAQYILNNPVRKELVATPEAWPWSGHINELPLH